MFIRASPWFPAIFHGTTNAAMPTAEASAHRTPRRWSSALEGVCKIEFFSELPLQELSRGVARQRVVGEPDVTRNLVLGQTCRAMRSEGFGIVLTSRIEHDRGRHLLAQSIVRNTKDGTFGNGGMIKEGGLDFGALRSAIPRRPRSVCTARP